MYDAVIVGAGPAGTSAALYAHKLGLKCILLDKALFPRDKICGDALSGKTVRILRELELLDGIENLEGSDINRITFGGPSHNKFDVHLNGDGDDFKQLLLVHDLEVLTLEHIATPAFHLVPPTQAIVRIE